MYGDWKMGRKKRILIYNWVPFDEKEGKGGGVTVYTKNLITYLTQLKDWEIFFLSSGRAYNRKREDIYIEKTRNCFEGKCNSYQIVNSPILSSAHLSFPYPEDYLEDRQLKIIVGDFLRQIGQLDVIHFQNLEGISLSVLELKQDFPLTKFVYTMHNYYPLCPQVMLWKEDSTDCSEKRCGEHCVSCMPTDVFKEKIIINQQINYDIENFGIVDEGDLKEQKRVEQYYEDLILNGRYEIDIERKSQLAHEFKKFRIKNIQYINIYMDQILAVSKRVLEIAVYFGIDYNKIKVSYIGTEVAYKQKGFCSAPYKREPFRICYLGYMRKVKGFYFLLDALEAIPDEIACKIAVTIAVANTDELALKRIKYLDNKFAEIIIYKGYTNKQLSSILENVQLGIVPSLWEDNLPQVAIEMKANGVAVLTSDLGGAKELTTSEKFVFEAGNQADFLEKLLEFVKCPETITEYWNNCPKLLTMQEHIDELLESYGMKNKKYRRYENV